jgi:hypothetical protein
MGPRLSVLLKSWRCLDDDMEILTEMDYRVHTSQHPDHRVVAIEEE